MKHPITYIHLSAMLLTTARIPTPRPWLDDGSLASTASKRLSPCLVYYTSDKAYTLPGITSPCMIAPVCTSPSVSPCSGYIHAPISANCFRLRYSELERWGNVMKWMVHNIWRLNGYARVCMYVDDGWRFCGFISTRLNGVNGWRRRVKDGLLYTLCAFCLYNITREYKKAFRIRWAQVPVVYSEGPPLGRV